MTIAPEKFKPEDVKYLADNGIILSVGHSNCSYEEAMQCFKSGATAATHLYNAMSGLIGREPGVIGAVLNNPDCYSAIIPDLHHVHPANIQIAVKIKPDHMFLVTDCHAPAGSAIKEFKLTGRPMYAREGMCTDFDGHLSGSNILMN
jgi:N-acetylglucosamine-6-phosphate deacetylase